MSRFGIPIKVHFLILYNTYTGYAHLYYYHYLLYIIILSPQRDE